MEERQHPVPRQRPPGRGDTDAATALFERLPADRERLYGLGHPLTELARGFLDPRS
ncbi:hypothetical protein [Streptomyces sp. NPDC127033]|uniref:hypothetical protein n=1 Tax=Streptomyces sp. NPDC127033 TaxID=3347110 RepID=UPI0036521210